LVSLDLIVVNPNGQVLLGKRVNEPAKGYWFVPGGRIQKLETIQSAIIRLMKEELGNEHYCGQYHLLGVYDHMYDTCFCVDVPTQTTTHNVSIGVQITLDEKQIDWQQICQQHAQAQWFTVNQLLKDHLVHVNTKKFFTNNMSNLINF